MPMSTKNTEEALAEALLPGDDTIIALMAGPDGETLLIYFEDAVRVLRERADEMERTHMDSIDPFTAVREIVFIVAATLGEAAAPLRLVDEAGP